MNIQNFRTIKVPILGDLGKMSFGCNPCGEAQNIL